jgi:hypothetical protein
MPFGILFASSSFLGLSIRQTYGIIGLIIVLPGLFFLFGSQSENEINIGEKQITG